MSSITQYCSRDDGTYDHFSDDDSIENEDPEDDIDKAMTDVTIELEDEDTRALIALLRDYQVPQALAEQIASLFDIEEDLKQRPQLIYTEALDEELSIGDLIGERSARLRSGVRELRRLKLLRTNADEVLIFDVIRAV